MFHQSDNFPADSVIKATKGKVLSNAQELHAHLNGSLSEETLKELGCLHESVSEYQSLTKLFNKTSRTLDECFTLFKIAHQATSNVSSIYKATTSVIEEFFKDNCIYLELRTTPRNEIGMTKGDYVNSIVQAIQDNKSAILVKLILSIDRRHDIENSRDTLKLVREMNKRYPNIVVGLDLCGNPNEGGFPEEIFRESKNDKLHVTLHCGEVVNEQEVISMLNFVPDRLGHATFIHPNYGGSKQCWELYNQKPIPIECCLTSNIVCGTVNKYKDHHIQEWIKQKLPFSLSTDDKGVFCTSLSREYFLASEYLGLAKEDLWNISYQSIDYTFTTDEERECLKNKLISWKDSFLV